MKGFTEDAQVRNNKVNENPSTIYFANPVYHACNSFGPVAMTNNPCASNSVFDFGTL